MRLYVLTASSALAVAAVFAAPIAADTPQERSETCHVLATARHLSGDAQTAFIDQCMTSTTVAQNGISGKQAACEELADSNHIASGAARRAFVGDCVKFH